MRKVGSLWLPEPPNILRRRTIEAKDPIALKIGVKGRIYVDLIDAATGIIKRHLEFDNIITDAGLNGFWNAGSTLTGRMSWAAVGTDSTAPATSQTALGAEISPSATHRTNSNGGITDVTTFVGASNYWKLVRTFVFVEAQANGNLTEIGIFNQQASGGDMWCRQLFKDGVGTPTTVVKTSSDQLRVTYEYRFFYPSADFSGTVTISAVVFDYNVRPNDVDNASGSWATGLTALNSSSICGPSGVANNGTAKVREGNALVANTSDLAGAGGSAVSATSTSLASYSNGNFYRDATATWEPGDGNFATGIGSMLIGYGGSLNIPLLFQVNFPNAQITKDNTKRLTITYRIAFQRH